MTAQPLEDDPTAGRLVSSVERSGERLTLTRDGEPAVVVIGVQELAGREDTVELLGDSSEAAAVDEGIVDVHGGRLHDEDDVLADLQRRLDQR